MKKKIVFVINKLTCGGAEKGLVSLLHELDYEQYEVDLFLFKHEGFLMHQLPESVNLLPEPKEYQYFDQPIKKVIIYSVVHLRFKLLWNRIRMVLMMRKEPIPAVREQKAWKFVCPFLKKLPNQYHAAIGFLEKNPNYFCVDKIDAKVKIGFVHTDYDRMQMDPKWDHYYFNKLNIIGTISEKCVSVLQQRFPEFEHKIKLMYNIVSESIINEMSNEPIKDTITDPSIVTLGRLNYEKALDKAIISCSLLVMRGIPVTWYVLGEGEERAKLEALIKEYKLEQHFKLLGLKENPYPYLKKATVYAQPSLFEGKSIAVDEAKIMQKPILLTNYPSASEQITDGVNGLIVDRDVVAVADGLERLLKEVSLRANFTKELALHDYETTAEIDKLYTWINL
ncbi:MAG: hypothetical protein RL607_517 [Bacteroidota bacterium]|jgi:glycosyltransferase involved in cell wall biosynthesis